MSVNATPKPTLGVGIIGSGLMAKAHTMAWRNLQAVYGSIGANIRLVVLVGRWRARSAGQDRDPPTPADRVDLEMAEAGTAEGP